MRAGLTVRRLWLAPLLVLGGCAASAEPACPGGGAWQPVAELLFGRNIGDRPGVSEADFRRYVEEELTPRFPDGLTIVDAEGQYRDRARGVSVREQSKLVLIAFHDSPHEYRKLEAAAEAYKRRFRQQAVGIIVKRACVSF